MTDFTETGVAIIDYEYPTLDEEDDESIETNKAAPTKSATNYGLRPVFKFTLDDDMQTVALLQYSPNWDKVKDSGAGAFDSIQEFEKGEAKLQYEKFGLGLDRKLSSVIRKLELYTRLLYENEIKTKTPKGKLFSANIAFIGLAAPTRIDFLNAERNKNVPDGVSLNTPGTKLFRIKIINGTGAIKISFNLAEGETTLTKQIAASASEEWIFQSGTISSIMIGATANSTVDITGIY